METLCKGIVTNFFQLALVVKITDYLEHVRIHKGNNASLELLFEEDDKKPGEYKHLIELDFTGDMER